MSYRELRNFTEMLRVMSFPKTVSMDSFRDPNFPLMAAILRWLIERMDPNVSLPNDLDTESGRVLFVRTAAQHLAVKENIRLNTKKLYTADGHAVQEMMKVVNVLYQAIQSVGEDGNHREEISESTIRAKLNEFKKSRQLASEITSRGADLYDELSKEITFREQREFVLNRSVNPQDVEQSLKDSIKAAEREIENVIQKIENVASDESNLDAKIEKRREDVERTRRRLEALKSVRPAYMDEFEKLEQELANYYEQYTLKFRCLAYLQQQIEEIEKNEMADVRKREESVRGIVTTNAAKSMFEEDEYERSDSPPEASEKEAKEKARNGTHTATVSRNIAVGKIALQGSMNSEQNDSLDSDIDLDGEDDASDLDSDDELELADLSSKTSAVESGRPNTAVKKREPGNSDDDDF